MRLTAALALLAFVEAQSSASQAADRGQSHHAQAPPSRAEPSETSSSSEDNSFEVDLAPRLAPLLPQGWKMNLSPLRYRIVRADAGAWTGVQTVPIQFSLSTSANTVFTGVVETGTIDVGNRGSPLRGLKLDMRRIGIDQLTRIGAEARMINWSLGHVVVQVDIQEQEGDTDAAITISGSEANVTGELAGTDWQLMSPSIDLDIRGTKLKAAELTKFLTSQPAVLTEGEGQPTRPTASDATASGKPLFRSVGFRGRLNSFAFALAGATMSGGSAALSEELDWTPDGGILHHAFMVSDMKLPVLLRPDWWFPLFPADVTLNYQIRGLNFSALADLLSRRLRWGKSGLAVDASREELLRPLFTGNGLEFALDPSSLVSDAYEVTANGAVTINHETPGAGSIVVRMKGLPTIIDLLKTAPSSAEVASVLYAAIALNAHAEKQDDNRQSWTIDYRPWQPPRLNGVPFPEVFGAEQ